MAASPYSVRSGLASNRLRTVDSALVSTASFKFDLGLDSSTSTSASRRSRGSFEAREGFASQSARNKPRKDRQTPVWLSGRPRVPK